MLQPEQLFLGRYKIVRQLGAGGMSTVYLAESVSLGTLWAIKEVHKDISHGDLDYLAEPNILKTLAHPMLPRIVDIEETAEAIYIIEDFIEGESLDKQLDRLGKIPEALVRRWTLELCDVLSYLHGHKPHPIIYRDMKPANLIAGPDGQLRIIDFGIARIYKKESSTDTTVIGTRGYAAPEQYGRAQSDARTDIYSLGVTLYHLLTGKSPQDPPYEILPIRTLDSSLSAGMEHIILKCTQQDPDKRYQNAQQLKEDMQQIDRFDEAYRAGLRRRRGLWALAAASWAASASLIIGGFLLLRADWEADYRSAIETGLMLTQQMDLEGAQQSFAAALKQAPGRLEGYSGHAGVLYAAGKYQEAADYIFEQLQQRFTKAPEGEESSYAALWYLLANCRYELQDYAGAAEAYGEAIRLQPQNAQYLRDMAVCAAKVGQLEEAGRYLEEAIRLGADVSSAAYVGAEILLYQGELWQAQEELLAALQATADSSLKQRIYLSLSQLYSGAGQAALDPDGTRRVQLLQQAAADETLGDSQAVLSLLARAYYDRAQKLEGEARQKQLQNAAECYERIVQKGYASYQVLQNLAIVYQESEEFGQAERILELAEEQNPNNYRVFLRKFFLYADEQQSLPLEQRDYLKAQESYQQAQQLYERARRISGEDAEMQVAESLMGELQENGWIK
ncbi:MAG: protein kinase [Provencibacterium sp.]|jgi:tetratricopeptide (TPR) repeat protein|nr:protein kinase [Provencibacterium sp.]